MEIFNFQHALKNIICVDASQLNAHVAQPTVRALQGSVNFPRPFPTPPPDANIPHQSLPPRSNWASCMSMLLAQVPVTEAPSFGFVDMKLSDSSEVQRCSPKWHAQVPLTAKAWIVGCAFEPQIVTCEIKPLCCNTMPC